MKIIEKPWGKEEWLELNDKYCYKRLYIDAGKRLSLQYHEKKLETVQVIEGECNVLLGDETKIMRPGDFFTIRPGTKHRFTAVTDVILHEVSTPEVDDVVRLEDDYDRAD